MDHQPPVQGQGRSRDGDIVFGGPQAAGDDDKPGLAQPRLQDLPDQGDWSPTAASRAAVSPASWSRRAMYPALQSGVCPVINSVPVVMISPCIMVAVSNQQLAVS